MALSYGLKEQLQTHKNLKNILGIYCSYWQKLTLKQFTYEIQDKNLLFSISEMGNLVISIRNLWQKIQFFHLLYNYSFFVRKSLVYDHIRGLLFHRKLQTWVAHYRIA